MSCENKLSRELDSNNECVCKYGYVDVSGVCDYKVLLGKVEIWDIPSQANVNSIL